MLYILYSTFHTPHSTFYTSCATLPTMSTFIEKPLIIIDAEFTSLDPLTQEVIEIGAIKVDQRTMEIMGRFEAKITPIHIATADPASLKVNGYTPESWVDAISSRDAFTQLATFAGEGRPTFGGWNVTLDWTFIAMAFREHTLENPFDFHVFDIRSVAAEYLKNESALAKISLSTTCTFLGIPPEPLPHRAVNGAETAYQVLKKLRETRDKRQEA